MSQSDRPAENSPTPSTPSGQRISKTPLIVAIVLTALITFGIVALLVNIFQRKQEAKNPYVRLVEVDENTTDPRVWGTNWSRQFDSYSRTVDRTHTRYGGSEGQIPESRIERDPWLKRMFLGYAFSIDFRDRRGHAYMLADQRQTLRVLNKPQAGACLHCHASIVPTWRRVGLEKQGKTLADAQGFDWPAVTAGFEAMSTIPYADAHAQLLKTPDGSPNDITPTPGGSSVATTTPANLGDRPNVPTTQEALKTQVGEAHPVSCVDCHDPKSMALRITRPGFVNGIRALAQAKEPDPADPSKERFVPVPHLPSIERWRQGSRSEPYDPNVDATRQEMRSFACAQCHVEYYCAPKMTLFFPWANGLKAEQIEKTYENTKFPDGTPFMDFKHAETGAAVFKAQHPEFETWSQGIHARAGVACADCHMPYTRVGAAKISEHHIQSPLLMINRSCQVCHPVSEDELLSRVHTIQDRTHALMERSGQALSAMLDVIVAVKKQGATEQQLAPIYALQRKGQWRLDFVNAENSMGFHADQETARVLGESIDFFRQGQLAAQKLLYEGATTRPASPTARGD